MVPTTVTGSSLPSTRSLNTVQPFSSLRKTMRSSVPESSSALSGPSEASISICSISSTRAWVRKKEKPDSPHAGLFTTPLMSYYKREISSRQAPPSRVMPARRRHRPRLPTPVCRASSARHTCNPQQFRLRRGGPEASCQRQGRCAARSGFRTVRTVCPNFRG